MTMKLKRSAYACLFASGILFGCGGSGSSSSYSSNSPSPLANNGTFMWRSLMRLPAGLILLMLLLLSIKSG